MTFKREEVLARPGISSVLQIFSDKVDLIIKDISDQGVKKSVSGYGVYDTAYNLNTIVNSCWKGKQAGAIIFSPPYANSFDYFESYKLELVI